MLPSKKIGIIDYIVVFVMIIYAGNATTFVRSTDTWDNKIGLLLPIGLIALYFIGNKTKITKKFLFFLGGYVLYFIASTIKYREVHPRFFEIYFMSFIIGYVLFSNLEYKLFKIYEDFILVLCVVALFLWPLLQINPDQFSEIFSHIAFSAPGSGNVKYNILIYTISDYKLFSEYVIDFGKFTLIRNPGFAWEPGAFATFINLAIFSNLTRTRFTFKHNFRFFIFVLALITTLSTTGYAVFFLLIMFYLYNLQTKIVIALTPFILGALIYLSTLPFMLDKIKELSHFDTESVIEYTITFDKLYTPQRFQSFAITFIDFKRNPILGYGGHDEDQWTAKLGAKVAPITGIGNLMAIFGSVGLVFFLFSLYQTSVYFTRIFEVKGWLFPFLMIIMISISYGLVFSPLVMAFWLFNHSYLPVEQQRKYLIKLNIHQNK